MAYLINLGEVNVKRDQYEQYYSAVESNVYNKAKPELCNEDFEDVMRLGANKKMLVRRTALMDPAHAARYAKKNNLSLNLGNDWDGDGVNDVVIHDDTNIRAINGWTTTDSDWRGKQKYYNQHKKDRKSMNYRDFIQDDLYAVSVNPNAKDGYTYRQSEGWTNNAYEGFAQPKLRKLTAYDIFKNIYTPYYKEFYERVKTFAKTNFNEICRLTFNILIVDLVNPKLGSLLKQQPSSAVKYITAIKNKKVCKDVFWDTVQKLKTYKVANIETVIRGLLCEAHGIKDHDFDINGALADIKAAYTQSNGATMDDGEINRFITAHPGAQPI